MSMATANEAAATLDAYEHWAPDYPPTPHNPLMRAEQLAMLRHWPELAGRRALDLACGTGRYAHLMAQEARQVVAVDFSSAMLSQVTCGWRVRAEMSCLPFRSAAFHVVVCGLAVAHAPDIDAWMSEVARVLAPGGVLLYSDFHPEAARAGMTRSFKDRNGRRWSVPHRHYDVGTHRRAALAAGLTVQEIEEIRLGSEITEEFTGSRELYERWPGLPMALVVCALKVQT
jgi:ubiquinone/menaquinone biosynthesis C-methylase UbiE